MSEEDRNYYLRRAEEELVAAKQASDETSASAHRKLAQRYRALTRELPPEIQPKQRVKAA